MRIRRVDIDSYGAVRNWHSPDLSGGIVLVTGDNEAGKTTIMEFIRGTMFPSRQQKYPAASKTDSGRLEVEMDSGERRTLVRTQRRVAEADGRRTPPEEFNMDAETYSSLFAMNIEQLTNSKIITSGEFRSRFLAVPGGENIPQVSDEIQAELAKLMTRDKLTDARVVGRLVKELKGIEAAVAEAESKGDEYDRLEAEKAALCKEVEEHSALQEVRQDARTRSKIMQSQSENVATLLGRRREREELARGLEGVPDGAKAEYDALKARLDSAPPPQEPAELPAGLHGNDPRILSRKEDEIEELHSAKQVYDKLVRESAELQEDADDAQRAVDDYCAQIGWTEKEARKVKGGRYISDRAEAAIGSRGAPAPRRRPLLAPALCLVAAAAAIAVCAAAGIRIWPLYGAAVAAAAVAAAVAYKRAGASEAPQDPDADWRAWIASEGYPPDTTPEKACMLAGKIEMIAGGAEARDECLSRLISIREEMRGYDRRAEPLCKAFGIERSTYGEDVDALHAMLKASREYMEANAKAEGANDERAAAEAAMRRFLRRYGTEEEFLALWAGREKLAELDMEIATLVRSIEASSKLPIAELVALMEQGGEPSAPDDGPDDAAVEEKNRRIGEIDAMQKALMDDGELDALVVRRTAAEAELDRAARRWAVLTLADRVLGQACDRFYTDMQPSVVRTANRYLRLMTDGRYQLDSDPRSNDIVIVDSVSRKKPGQWSTGLGDQVYLSMKLAIAKETGAEKMPVILDDVLLRFDAARKQGACAALHDFADGQQVILFTCDRSLAGMLSLGGRIDRIELGGKG